MVDTAQLTPDITATRVAVPLINAAAQDIGTGDSKNLSAALSAAGLGLETDAETLISVIVTLARQSAEMARRLGEVSLARALIRDAANFGDQFVAATGTVD